MPKGRHVRWKDEIKTHDRQSEKQEIKSKSLLLHSHLSQLNSFMPSACWTLEDLLGPANGENASIMKKISNNKIVPDAKSGKTRLTYISADYPKKSFTCKHIEILLEKGRANERDFGFVLQKDRSRSKAANPGKHDKGQQPGRGGEDGKTNANCPLIVTQINPTGAAAREGTLRVGDRVIEVNGINIVQVTVQMANLMMQQSGNDVILLVEYDVAVFDCLSEATGPVVVEIENSDAGIFSTASGLEKPPFQGPGVTFASQFCSQTGRNVISIDSIYDAGIADRSGLLHVGDHVLSIDGIELDGKTEEEAADILEKCSNVVVQLLIYPASVVAKQSALLSATKTSETESKSGDQSISIDENCNDSKTRIYLDSPSKPSVVPESMHCKSNNLNSCVSNIDVPPPPYDQFCMKYQTASTNGGAEFRRLRGNGVARNPQNVSVLSVSENSLENMLSELLSETGSNSSAAEISANKTDKESAKDALDALLENNKNASQFVRDANICVSTEAEFRTDVRGVCRSSSLSESSTAKPIDVTAKNKSGPYFVAKKESQEENTGPRVSDVDVSDRAVNGTRSRLQYNNKSTDAARTNRKTVSNKEISVEKRTVNIPSALTKQEIENSLTKVEAMLDETDFKLRQMGEKVNQFPVRSLSSVKKTENNVANAMDETTREILTEFDAYSPKFISQDNAGANVNDISFTKSLTSTSIEKKSAYNSSNIKNSSSADLLQTDARASLAKFCTNTEVTDLVQTKARANVAKLNGNTQVTSGTDLVQIESHASTAKFCTSAQVTSTRELVQADARASIPELCTRSQVTSSVGTGTSAMISKTDSKAPSSTDGKTKLSIPPPAAPLDDIPVVSYHKDFTEVVLCGNHNGYGVTIESVDVPELYIKRPTITHIEANSEAERCGTIQKGDIVLSINGQNVTSCTSDEIRDLIEHSSGILRLVIEFEVSDFMGKENEILRVKLIKRGTSIGLTLSCPTLRKIVEPLLISDVKKGTVAHRCGCIHVGDRLLEIQDRDISRCSFEEAAKLLKNSADSVCLTILKTGLVPVTSSAPGKLSLCLSQTPTDHSEDSSSAVTYSIELIRSFSQPLGIGVQSMDGKILISSIEEASLADQTGAVHEGDEILEINSTSLENKSLLDVQALLSQLNSSLEVERIALRIKPNRRKNHKLRGKNQDSIDSAVESWDSPSPKNIRQSSNSFPATITAYENSLQQTISYPKNEMKIIADVHCSSDNFPSFESLPTVVVNNNDQWSCQLDELDQLPLYCDSFSDLPTLESGFGAKNGSATAASRDKLIDYNFQNSRSNSLNSSEHASTKCSKVNELCRHLSNSRDSRDSLFNHSPADAETHARGERYSPGKSNSGGTGANEDMGKIEEMLDNIFTPTPVELLKVVLKKEKSSDNFGFSLSDGIYEKGVYVSGVRPGGPASDGLKMFDRILQVNKIKTKDFQSHQVVSLIPQFGNQVELVVSRNTLASPPELISHGRSVDKSCREHPQNSFISNDFLLWRPSNL